MVVVDNKEDRKITVIFYKSIVTKLKLRQESYKVISIARRVCCIRSTELLGYYSSVLDKIAKPWDFEPRLHLLCVGGWRLTTHSHDGLS